MYEHDGAHELMWIEGQVRDTHSHSQAVPRWRRYGSIVINEELLASDLPLRRDLGTLPPKPDFAHRGGGKGEGIKT